MTAWDFVSNIFGSPSQLVSLIIIIIIFLVFVKYTGLAFKPGKGFKGLYFKENANRDRRISDDVENNKGRRSADLTKVTLEKITANVGEIKNDIGILTESVEMNRLETLKLSFYSNANIQIRMMSGLEYVHLGGNGPVLDDLKTAIKENPEAYKTVCLFDYRLSLDNLKKKKVKV